MKILVDTNFGALNSMTMMSRKAIYAISQNFDVFIYDRSYANPIDWTPYDTPRVNERIKEIQAKSMKKVDLIIYADYPMKIYPPDHNIPIFVYQPWELNHIPTKLKFFLNSYAKAIIGTSPHDEQTYSKDTDIPAAYVPPALDDIWYDKYEKIDSWRTNILVDGGQTFRKGWGLIINTLKSFASIDEVYFIIKGSKAYQVNAWPDIKDLGANVEYTTKNLSLTQMHDMYRRADIFYSPTLGEGFFFGAAQALTMNITTVLPDHTGMRQYMSNDVGYAIPSHPQSFENLGVGVGVWLDPKVGYDFGDEPKFCAIEYEDAKHQLDCALLRKHPKKSDEFMRTWMSKFSLDSIADQWRETIENLTEDLTEDL